RTERGPTRALAKERAQRLSVDDPQSAEEAKMTRSSTSATRRLLWVGALLFLAQEGVAVAGEGGAERVCAALAARPDDAKVWLEIAGQLASGARLPCRGQLQQRFIGGA